MNETYSTKIKPYLTILGKFKDKQSKIIEDRLRELLEQKGLSTYRYNRYKNDDTPLYHEESELIHGFFVREFDLAIEVANSEGEDKTYVETLYKWRPLKSTDIYWHKEQEAVPAST